MKPIFVHRESTLVSQADVEQMVHLCSYQLQHHIAPAWMRTPVPVYFTTNKKAAPAGSYLITILDDSDQANALGYHDETSDGVIYGRVFVKPVLDNGGDALHKELSVASVLSHEICEAFIDPNCNRWAEDSQGTMWCVEGCDAVENYSYVVSNGNQSATLSDFVMPAFFDAEAPLDHNLFDYLGKLSGPFTIAPGGYSLMMKGGKITQKFGKEYPAYKKASKQSPLARTARRKALANAAGS